MRPFTLAAVIAGLVVASSVGARSPAVEPARAAAVPSTTGLVLNYGFDADVGVVARDAGPSAINGTYVNTTATAARSAGLASRLRAIRLVGGQHQYVAVPERNALD